MGGGVGVGRKDVQKDTSRPQTNTGGSQAKETERKETNDIATSARTSFMAPPHAAFCDLPLKYRLEVAPSLKIVPA